jgi:hypothetical protein
MKSTILGFAMVVIGLACSAFGEDYKDLAARGYRWVTVEGPYACTTESEVRRITAHRTDATELEMVEGLEAYYLIPGSIVYVHNNDPATGMSEIQLTGVTRPLWTYTRFLSTRPIEDVYGVIETPKSSGLISSESLGAIQLPVAEPVPMPRPGPTATIHRGSAPDTSGMNPE